MTSNIQDQTKEYVLSRIQPYIASMKVEDGENTITAEIDADYVIKNPYAWHVRIIPSQEPSRFWRLTEELSVIMEDIAEKENINVYLIASEARKKTVPAQQIIAA
jgi:hypothetical protein